MTDKPQLQEPPQELYPPLAALLSALGPSNNEDDSAPSAIAAVKDNRTRSAFAPPTGQGDTKSYEALPSHLRTALDEIHNPKAMPFMTLENRIAAMTSKGPEEEEEIDTDSNAAADANPAPTQTTAALSTDAKRRRRQEINRESARRVRKRKTEAHKQLQTEVAQLKKALSTAQGDQAVTVRYACELYKEYEAAIQKSTDFENKWIAAEVQLVSLRQDIDKLRAKHAELEQP